MFRMWQLNWLSGSRYDDYLVVAWKRGPSLNLWLAAMGEWRNATIHVYSNTPYIARVRGHKRQVRA
jgi:hypothetical protein